MKIECYRDEKTERFLKKEGNEIYAELLAAIERCYGLDIDGLMFLGARCQIDKFRVDSKQGSFLLSIHNAIWPERVWNRLAVVESQWAWQEAMARDTDFAIPTAICDQDGDRVVLLPYTNAYNEAIKCVLSNWLPGVAKDVTPETAQIVGKVGAEIHRHSEQWQRPLEFTRPIQDAHWLQEGYRDLYQAKRDGRFSESEYEIMGQAIDKACAMLASVGKSAAVFGPIHGDLCNSQFIYGSQIGVVDFDDCALSYYTFDIGIALLLLRQTPECQQAFLNGYESVRSLSGHDKKLIETFMVTGKIWRWSWVAQKPGMTYGDKDSFFDRLCKPFLNGERILFA